MTDLWIGRFAPTPSGPLHFGSLVAALGSYVIARQRQGQWLMRIEDLDPPREMPGAADDILRTLEAFGFEWDGEIVYQSQRDSAYKNSLDYLEEKHLVYYCDCSRKTVQERNAGIYDRYCRDRELIDFGESAARIRFNETFAEFNDEILGLCTFNQPENSQDFVVRRRDGLYAYQLAVVVDDIEQGVNHVVRGADILDSTPRQNYIYHCLGKTPPSYYHLPLVVDESGHKFSKSKFSPAIRADKATEWLVKAFQHLGQNCDKNMLDASPNEFLFFAVNNFELDKVGVNPVTYQDLQITHST